MTVFQAYGIVWKAIDRKTGEVVALKKIFDAFRNQTDAQVWYLCTIRSLISKHMIDFCNTRLMSNSDLFIPQRTFREIMFLQDFGDHPNVIKLHNVIKADNDKDIYLVFEFMGK